MPSRGGADSDSDSELDIEGEGPCASPDISAASEENNNDNNRSRDRHDSNGGGDDDSSDQLNKTSSSPTLSPIMTSLAGGGGGLIGGLSSHTSWPSHPAFTLAGAGLTPPTNPLQAAHTLNKITSQFWAGFDRPAAGLNPLLPPVSAPPGGNGVVPPHPLEALSFNFPLSFPAALSQSMFKLPNVEESARHQLFRFKTS